MRPKIYGQIEYEAIIREGDQQAAEDTDSTKPSAVPKKELDSAIQAEHVKATLSEDEASIGAFYRRFAHATMDTTETRDLLFDYFIDKIFVGNQALTIASWFFDGGTPIDHSELTEAKGTVSLSV